MDINSDLMIVQGMITSLNSTQGELRKILFKGGNEKKINKICETLKHFLKLTQDSNNKQAPNTNISDKFNNIIMLLLLNTEFSTIDDFDDKDYVHFRNIMPQLSQCVFINILLEIDLIENLLSILERFPLQLLVEVCNELAMNLKISFDATEHIYGILASIIKRSAGLNMNVPKTREIVSKLNSVFSDLLVPILGVQIDSPKMKEKKKIYQQMGFRMLNLLQLLLKCHIEDFAHAKIIDMLVNGTLSIISLINIDVFVEWAEVKLEDEILQIKVGESAYHFLQKYSNFKPANECIDMLKNTGIARKPKSLNEVISEADVPTIIRMINKEDENQHLWYKALLNTDFLNCIDSRKCLETHHHLFGVDDFVRLLKNGMNFESDETKQWVLKCSENLNNADLIIASIKHFSFVGLRSNYQFSNVHNKLMLMLNAINGSDKHELGTEDDIIRQILLLFIENPVEVVKVLSYECVNNEAYNHWLKYVFRELKVLFSFELVALNALHDLIKDRTENHAGLKAYILMLLETGVCDENEIIGRILKPQLEDYIKEKNYESIKFILEILKNIHIDNKINDDLNHKLVLLLVNVLETNRHKITNFDETHVDILIDTVAVLKNLQQIENETKSTNLKPLNRFYINHSNKRILDYIYGSFSIENEADAIAKLLKVLSKCVPNEWSMILNDLSEDYGVNKAVDILTATLILISQASNVMTKQTFKFYLQCYGISIKNLQESYKSNHFGMNLIKNLCMLIDEIPVDLRYEEGLKLTLLFPEESLKLLATDPVFCYTLGALKEQQLCKIIANKMLE